MASRDGGEQLFICNLTMGMAHITRIIQLRGGGTMLSLAVAHMAMDGRSCMKVRVGCVSMMPLMVAEGTPN